ncbi:hypothetical protein M2399_004979 [Pseudomonas sp. BIGb0450]|nr:hypothetical protein [Pseudomonas sp. BIGb0450]
MERLLPPHRPRAMGPKRKNAATGFARANRMCDVFVVDGATAVGYLWGFFSKRWANRGWVVYISVAAVTAAYGSALTAGHFWQTPGMPAQPKVTKRSLPHHSVPRLGSACRNEGPVPRAAATGHPWPGAAKSASLPIYPLHRACLRPSWLTGPADQDQKQINIKSTQPRWRSTAATGWLCFSVGAGLPAMQATRSFRYTEVMPSQASQLLQWTVPALAFDLAFASPHSSRPVGRCAVDLLLILILGAPLNHAGRTQVVRSG